MPSPVRPLHARGAQVALRAAERFRQPLERRESDRVRNTSNTEDVKAYFSAALGAGALCRRHAYPPGQADSGAAGQPSVQPRAGPRCAGHEGWPEPPARAVSLERQACAAAPRARGSGAPSSGPEWPEGDLLTVKCT